MFRLSNTLCLSDPDAPAFTPTRMPQSLEILDTEVVAVTWTDGSFELYLCDVPYAVDEALGNPTLDINPARLRNLALQSLEQDDVNNNNDNGSDNNDWRGRRSSFTDGGGGESEGVGTQTQIPSPHANVMRRLLTVDVHLAVIQQPKLTLPRAVSGAPIATEFTAAGISCFHRLSWSTALAGGAYLYELITAGLDRRICHWGVRLTASPSAVSVDVNAASGRTGSSTRAGVGVDQSGMKVARNSSGGSTRYQNKLKAMSWEADLLGVIILLVLV